MFDLRTMCLSVIYCCCGLVPSVSSVHIFFSVLWFRLRKSEKFYLKYLNCFIIIVAYDHSFNLVLDHPLLLNAFNTWKFMNWSILLNGFCYRCKITFNCSCKYSSVLIPHFCHCHMIFGHLLHKPSDEHGNRCAIAVSCYQVSTMFFWPLDTFEATQSATLGSSKLYTTQRQNEKIT